MYGYSPSNKSSRRSGYKIENCIGCKKPMGQFEVKVKVQDPDKGQGNICLDCKIGQHIRPASSKSYWSEGRKYNAFSEGGYVTDDEAYKKYADETARINKKFR